MLFDDGWSFHRGDSPGAQHPGFDDAGWRRLDLPHDWSIEDVPGAPPTPEPWAAPAALWSEQARPPSKTEMIPVPKLPPERPGGPPRRTGPFDPAASDGGWSTGWTVGGVGWYRKRFSAAAFAPDERVELRFDGAYLVADVWLNGTKLGTHDHGHSGFAFDLTPHLRRDAPNLLAVRVANEGFTSRWYNGSGLYRHVWLTRTRDVRLPLWGVFVSTAEASEAAATLRVAVEIDNHRATPTPVTITVDLKDASGRMVGRAERTVEVTPARRTATTLQAVIRSPRLWSPDDPAMYTAEVSLSAAGRETDRFVQPFGIRTVAVDARTGLSINGRPLKLKGACVHADNGLLGTAAIDGAEIRKAELLKASGFNAVRCAHNLFSPAFLDACDRLGLIVMEETFDVWNEGKFGHDLGAKRFKTRYREDTADMVRRDRNHPSIVFWNIGNEIPERNAPLGIETSAVIREIIRELDPTRLITAALSWPGSGKRGEPSRRGLDAVGYNYMHDAFEPDHAENPEIVFMSTETYAGEMHDAWRLVEKHPWLMGDFAWTGIDFIGEVGVGSSQLRRDGEQPPRSMLPFTLYHWDYPFYLAGCGERDILGRKKSVSFYRDVLWQRSPIELFVQRPTPDGYHEELSDWAWHDELPSWTWPSARMLTVRAYCAGDEVRLRLNGREVGRKRISADDRLKVEFQIAYQPGELVAIGYRDGAEIGRKTLTTVGAPARIRIRAEQPRVVAAPGALAYTLVEICDAEGRLLPDAQTPLTFAVQGSARLLAVGSANPRGIESFRDTRCTTFHGVAQAILAPTGAPGVARLSVTSPGLADGRARIRFG